MDEFAFICAAVRTSYARVGRPGCMIAALSGGADSVLLLRVLHALRDELSFDLRAVHVNHGLRENAVLDEAFCRQLCSDMNVPLQVFHVQVSDRGSVEDAARRARYAAFAKAMPSDRSALLALAHHMDDQAETVLMHLIYGSGMTGLSGMRELSGVFWRPLLTVRRRQIRDALTALHQPWREDESNQDTVYTRNYLRAQALPVIEQASASAVPAICRAADILRQEDALLNHLAQNALCGACGTGEHCFVLLEALARQEPAMQRRMLRIYAGKAGLTLDYEQTERLRSLLDAPDGSYANLPCDWRALRTRTRLHLLPPNHAVCMPAADALRILPGDGKCGDGRLMQAIPDAVLARGITLRTRRTGDFIRPFGMHGAKKLKDYLIDRQIDLPFRDAWPLVCQDSEVLWVIGVGASEALRTASDDQTAKLMAYTGMLPDAI